ncbi:DUF3429 domain-containing protein [Altererythrobacter lauratis]|uniref:DUF3429 domain-containing protein n=1 Tax=Alteraurantiacibacter lauratis TaxID=2054627 RepID=A0ABV7EGW9_9SPHN
MLACVPPFPRWLGLAGLLPQAACLLAVWSGVGEWRWTALAAAWAYAALIFSFLGGMWWGIAAARLSDGRAVPAWVWLAAVAPSLIALASFMPWVFGYPWPAPSLAVLALLLLASPLVDARLGDLVPQWWLRLRLALSLGLGTITLLLAMGA